jgi:SAM-dependent methyltransferase
MGGLEGIGVTPNGKACLGCDHPLGPPFLDLGPTPLANALIRPEDSHLREPCFPLAVAYCSHCHLVQVTNPLPPETLFCHYHYFSSYSDSFLSHSSAMADDLCLRFGLAGGSKVLEVASNDGYFLQYLLQRGITVLGVEPARNIAKYAEDRGIPTLNCFFERSVEEIIGRFGEADLIVGNNILAHVRDIGKFLLAIRECLKPDGHVVFEFPYLKDLLDNTEFDTIYHEHVFYFSISALTLLARRAGLHLYDASCQAVHGGSLRVFLEATGKYPVSATVQRLLAEEKRQGLTTSARYAAFSRKVAAVKMELVDLLRELKNSGKKLAAYGAPAKGSTLLNYCGIGAETLEFTVDRSPYKQGLLMPGSRLPVLPPEHLLESMPAYTLILPWNLADEIRSQQSEYCARGGRFIVPIPHPVIDGSARPQGGHRWSSSKPN